MLGKFIEVLLVEDDPGDVELALECSGEIKLNMNVVDDGVEAMAYLHQ